MGRPQRIHYPGAICHVMSKGNDGMSIFESPEECLKFLTLLTDVKARTGLLVLAYCLMTTHFHLLVAATRTALSTIMHRTLSRYSHWFNWRRGRNGHVFQDRYKTKFCLDDAYLNNVLPYVHRNPVKAGMVADPTDWRWSSARQYVRAPRSTLLDLDYMLSKLGNSPSSAMNRYAAMMGIPSDWEPDYDDYTTEVVPVPAAIARPSLQEIAASTESRTGRAFLGLEGRQRTASLSAARRDFTRSAVENGYGQREIARFMGLSKSAVHELSRPDA